MVPRPRALETEQLTKEMPEWIIIILVLAAYYAVMRWMLPWLGVPT